MDKPQNPYKPGTIIYRLMSDDWSMLTIEELVKYFNTTRATIVCSMSKIKDETGYCVPHFDGRKLRWNKCKENKNKC